MCKCKSLAKPTLLAVSVEVLSCQNGETLLGTFEIPDTGYSDLNHQLAERKHVELYGPTYECTRCSGGDYHFARYIRIGQSTGKVWETPSTAKAA